MNAEAENDDVTRRLLLFHMCKDSRLEELFSMTAFEFYPAGTPTAYLSTPEGLVQAVRDGVTCKIDQCTDETVTHGKALYQD